MPIRLATPNPEENKALGESEAFLSLQERISRVAKTDRPVILLGERGTGKEMAAARLHLLSQRWNQPYVTLNCASLTPTLIESELFGHEAGAFTGAIRLRRGRFEMANGGTLFLDEVATLPMTVQEKILRVVEYGQMERVGSSETQRVDVRLIAATNTDLRQMAREGKFRQDLLDRLSFEVITLPPLRRRREDILLLAEHFARRMAHELNLGFTPAFSEAARRVLMDYAWPGNIRELKNVVERMVYRAGGEAIETIIFDPFEAGGTGENGDLQLEPDYRENAECGMRNAEISSAEGGGRRAEISDAPALRARFAEDLAALPLPEAVRALEVQRLRQALEECRYNQRKAAGQLGLTYHQFRGYFRKYREELE